MSDSNTQFSAPAFINSSSLSRDEYVKRFKSFHRKTAEAIVGMGRIVFAAKTGLQAEDFRRFMEEIHVKGSTLRKYERIGRYADVFDEHIDRLPCNWTSIYMLTQAEEGLNEALEKVRPSMCAEQIREIVEALNPCSELNTGNERKQLAKSKGEPDIAFKLVSAVAPQTVNKLKAELEAVFERHGIAFELKLSAEMLDLAEEASIGETTESIEHVTSEVTQ